MIDGAAPAGLHPSHLGTLAPTVSAAVLVAVSNHTRFAARFRTLLPPALAEAPLPEPERAAERMALCEAARIETAGLMMGAAWHARSVGRCISSQVVVALEAGIGREVRVFGLRSAAQAVAPAGAPAAEVLVERIRADGLRCLVRWRDGLAEPWRTLATLKLPRDGLPAGATEEAEPIIAAVAERVADSD